MLMVLLFSSWGVPAQPQDSMMELEMLRQQTIELNRDFEIYEESLSKPLVIYFSINADQKFRIKSLRVLLDGKLLKLIEYDDKSRRALDAGGAQLVFSGSVLPGKHELIAYYISDRDYQGGTSRVIQKQDETQYMEIEIQKQNTKKSRLQPDVMIREWKAD
jgi:hypothetical protein